MRLWIYLGLMAVFVLPAGATELIYRPVNPAFGGNPLNGPTLLNEATAQNGFKAPIAEKTPTPTKSQLQLFKDNLERAILNKLAFGTSQNIFDANGNINLGASLDFGDFSVQVSPNAVNGNVTINISDGITNTELTVPYVTSKP